MKKFAVAFFRYQPNLFANFRKTEVCVVLSQHKAVFGTAGHHAVRLEGFLCGDVVHKHPDVTVVSGKNYGRFAVNVPFGVYSCHNALRRRFFVTACSVYLSCKKQALNVFCHKCCVKLRCVDAIVLYCVGVTHNFHIFQPFDAVVNLFLHPRRHGRGRPLNVKFAGVGRFRLQKYLMTLLVAETHHLVFYAGAVTWTYAVYGTVVQRCQMFVL